MVATCGFECSGCDLNDRKTQKESPKNALRNFSSCFPRPYQKTFPLRVFAAIFAQFHSPFTTIIIFV